MRYRIFYHDGGVGMAREWPGILYWVQRSLQLPPAFHPAIVLPDPDEDGDELVVAVGRALAKAPQVAA